MPVFPRTPFSFPTTKAKAIVHQATARQHARRAALCGRSPDDDDIDFSPLSRRLRLSPCRPRRGCVESRPRPDRWGRRSRRCPCSQRGAKWAKAWRDRWQRGHELSPLRARPVQLPPQQRRPRLDQIRFARNRGLPQGAPRRARYLGHQRGRRRRGYILDDLMGAGKPTGMALRNASQSRTAQRATTPKRSLESCGSAPGFQSPQSFLSGTPPRP